MFHDIKKIIPKSVQRSGLSERLEEWQILEDFSSIIRDFLTPEQASRVKPMSLLRRTLAVASLSDSALAKIKANETEILEKINKKAGFRAIKQISYLT